MIVLQIFHIITCYIIIMTALYSLFLFHHPNPNPSSSTTHFVNTAILIEVVPHHHLIRIPMSLLPSLVRFRNDTCIMMSSFRFTSSFSLILSSTWSQPRRHCSRDAINTSITSLSCYMYININMYILFWEKYQYWINQIINMKKVSLMIFNLYTLSEDVWM